MNTLLRKTQSLLTPALNLNPGLGSVYVVLMILGSFPPPNLVY